MNNPIFFTDPDRKEIWIGNHLYSYKKDRDYDSVEDEFLRESLRALDNIYSTDAMVLDYDGDGETENLLDILINDKDVKLSVNLGNKTGHSYGKISFNYKDAVIVNTGGATNEELAKASETGMLEDNMALTPPSSSLAHEIIHGYGFFFDNNPKDYDRKKRSFIKGSGYWGRKIDYSDDANYDDSTKKWFSSGEERKATTLGNKVNKKLGEAQRWDYRAAQGPVVESSTSIIPVTATGND